MEQFNFFYENVILIPVITFLFSVFIKWILMKIKDWEVNLDKAFWTWWMPSVHSSVVVSLTTALYLKYWIHEDLFVVAFIFSMIIIYDAINIRFEAWQHAKELNRVLWDKKYKESLWHLPSEAFAWSLVWVIIAILLYMI